MRIKQALFQDSEETFVGNLSSSSSRPSRQFLELIEHNFEVVIMFTQFPDEGSKCSVEFPSTSPYVPRQISY